MTAINRPSITEPTEPPRPCTTIGLDESHFAQVATTTRVRVPKNRINSMKRVRFDLDLSVAEIESREELGFLQKQRLYYSKDDCEYFRRTYDRQMVLIRQHMPSRHPRRMVPITRSALAA